MGNSVAFIDQAWVEHSRPGVLAAQPVRIAPAEELIWHRLFISERHRHDMSDIVHLILCVGNTLDWDRLVTRVGPHWPLLLAQLQMFSFVYPGYRSNVPSRVMERLLDQARAENGRDEEDPTCPGHADLPFQLRHRTSGNGASLTRAADGPAGPPPAGHPRDRSVRRPGRALRGPWVSREGP
jgi:hypothetical protein